MGEDNNGKKLNKKASKEEQIAEQEREGQESASSSERGPEELTDEYLADIDTRVENLSAQKERQIIGLKEQAAELEDKEIDNFTQEAEDQLAEVEEEAKEAAEEAKEEMTDNLQQENGKSKEKKPEKNEPSEKLEILEKALQQIESVSQALIGVKKAASSFIEESRFGINSLLRIVEDGNRKDVMFRGVGIMADSLLQVRRRLNSMEEEIQYLEQDGEKISTEINSLLAQAKKPGEDKFITRNIEDSEANFTNYLKRTEDKIEDIRKKVAQMIAQIEENNSQAETEMRRTGKFLSDYSPSADVSQTIVGDYRRNSQKLEKAAKEESSLLSRKISECSDNIKVARGTYK